MDNQFCIKCEHCFTAYTPHGVWVHLCRQAGVSTFLTKIKACPLGYVQPKEKEHDLTGSVRSLYNI